MSVLFKKIWAPMSPEYMSVEQWLMINYIDDKEKTDRCLINLKEPGERHRFVFYFSFRGDSYSLGITLMCLLFPKLDPMSLKRSLHSKLTTEEIT
jgi:hypothetical protein